MKLSETVKLYLNKEQRALIQFTMNEYIRTVNSIVSIAVSGVSIKKYSSKDVDAELPSAIRSQCARHARSIIKKHYSKCRKAVSANRRYIKKGSPTRVKAPKLPVLKQPCFYVNNQNFKIDGSRIEFPVWINGKSKRISILTSLTKRQLDLLSGTRLGTLRIVVKNNNIVAQIVYEATEPQFKTEGNVMGVDLGIKCPAVSYTTDGSVKFYGNGRKNRYMRKHYAYLRRKAQKAKKPKAVIRIGNKEQRIMRDIDHKLSREIVNTAVAHNVKVIKLEQLQNIRSTTRASRKNNRSLHNWSFYRLAQFIEYKAKLAGIRVEYVNPAYTSQKCPVCGCVHHADDRNYVCQCGYHTHRDLLGAINICYSTELIGKR